MPVTSIKNIEAITAAAPWIDVARQYEGVHEISGKSNNPKILDLLDWADGDADTRTLGGISNDEVPWCATYVSGVLEQAGVEGGRTAWARSYLSYGTKLEVPAYGCIVVFERGPNAGHVGFCVGKDPRGNLMILGGNQSDAVNVKPFSKTRVLGYRWPKDQPVPTDYTLPLVRSDGKLSKNEA